MLRNGGKQDNSQFCRTSHPPNEGTPLKLEIRKGKSLGHSEAIRTGWPQAVAKYVPRQLLNEHPPERIAYRLLMGMILHSIIYISIYHFK